MLEKRSIPGMLKEHREGQCGTESKGEQGLGDLGRRPGLAAMVRTWIHPEAGGSPWRVLWCSSGGSTCSATSPHLSLMAWEGIQGPTLGFSL